VLTGVVEVGKVVELTKAEFDLKGEVKPGEKAAFGFVGELPRLTVDLAPEAPEFSSCLLGSWAWSARLSRNWLAGCQIPN
jgi:hypothetical protein